MGAPRRGTELAARRYVFQVEAPARELSPFVELVGAARVAAIVREAEGDAGVLGQRTVWNVNTAASGGGVAEIPLVPALRARTRHRRPLARLRGAADFFASPSGCTTRCTAREGTARRSVRSRPRSISA